MVISVTQLNNFLKALVDNEPLLGNIEVKGEISTLRYSGDAAYFILKDDAAQIDCFYYNYKNGFQNGASVIIAGRPNYYAKGGKLSFCVTSVRPVDEKGKQRLALLLLKDKLEKEGCFDAARKRAVPHCAMKIGVVTSADGAAIHDICTVAWRRSPATDIVLFPVRVQGENSAAEIVRGLDYFCNSDVDVVIVGRGGGSDEDLSVFDAESVVRAVNRCSKPVISAVGHEINFSLCDLASDARAATPSAAAEICTVDALRQLQAVNRRLNEILADLESKLMSGKRFVQYVSTAFIKQSEELIFLRKQAVEKFCAKIADAAETRFTQAKNKTTMLSAMIAQNNPMKLLRQGYSAVTAEDGKRIRSVDEVSAGQTLKIYVNDGTVTATATDKEKI